MYIQSLSVQIFRRIFLQNYFKYKYSKCNFLKKKYDNFKSKTHFKLKLMTSYNKHSNKINFIINLCTLFSSYEF